MQQTVERRPHSPHKKRYWIVCADCHQRKRVAHPAATYCGPSCAKHAQRVRKKEREVAEQARIAAETLAQKKHADEVLQRREKARQERALKSAENFAENRRLEELKAKEQDRIKRRVLQPCECGSEIWAYHPEEKPLLGRIQPAKLECITCGKMTIASIVPLACPRCQHRWLYIKSDGEKKCRHCKLVY